MIPQLIVNDEPSIQDVPLTTETVIEKTASMSMPFIKNEGQADPKVKFYANTFAGTAYLTENDLTYVIPTEDGSFVIKETPHGGDFTPSADTPSETTVNYFKGTEENWHTDIPTYDSVSAGFVWDGVSLSLKAYGNNIEKLFTVFPGTNPDVIKMNFDGVESLSVDKSGELLLHTSAGDITMTAPVAYQHIDGIKKFVPVKYSTSNTIYGFVLGDYEKTLPVVIDPLLASTFLGGSGLDIGYRIAIDSSDNVYVTGYTDDTTDLPTTGGAYDESHNGDNDAFVSKFSSDLTSLSASTFLGGSGDDWGLDIAIDSSGNVYVTGYTEDDTTDLPVTSGAYDESHNGLYDAFVSKFSSDLTSLSESTYLGGSGLDIGYGIAIDSSDNVYVTGYAADDLPVTSGAYDESNNGSSDVFVSKFSFDNTGPTVTITSSSGDCGDTVNSTTLSYTVTFSESTSNFVVGDITVTGTANGGSPEASNFAGSGTTYTFDVVKGSSDGTVIVSVAAGVATDAAGNDNTASDSCTFTIDTAVTTTTASSSPCSRFAILGNCGTIAINNDVYSIIRTWTNVPTTEVLVGEPVTVTLSTPNNPTHTKIHFASVHTEVFSIPLDYQQSAHIDYSIMNNQVTYVSQSQLFQVAGATHRIVQDPDVKNLKMFEVVFTMVFAKPMDTSHIVVETKNKFGIPETLYLLDALKVIERPIELLTMEEKSKFEIISEPELKVSLRPDMDIEPNMYMLAVDPEPVVSKVTCGKGTMLKDSLCVSNKMSFYFFINQFMRLFG